MADNSNKELAASKGEEADGVLTGWLTQEGFAWGYFHVQEACLCVRGWADRLRGLRPLRLERD